jgi:hypothetical protein
MRNPTGTTVMLRWLAPGLLLAAGFAGVASAAGTTVFDGQYAGTLTLEGIVNGDCTQPPLGAVYPLTLPTAKSASTMSRVASELRTDMLMRLEEQANRLPVLLIVPMNLFILPSLFLIIMGRRR